ncbi:MAG: cobalt transporter CbiM [Deltaproteobacteria bacterium]|nr:cobalt transporter CbiM [Deltaproteobacteria bacterium]
MHIPDGYLSPRTCVVFYAAMAPVWYAASKKVEAAAGVKGLPLLALGAAFAFVVMMFNLPVPGGSTGHMTGAAVVAIALGPWAAVVAMTLTVALQAFLFGDGGITAIGANSFNMAFVMSFAGYYVYRVIAAGGPGRARVWLASFIAAYVSVNAAALCAALELGIAPAIARGADGAPLYAPYPLSVTLPAMLTPHLLFFGLVEGLGTALVVSYIRKTGMASVSADMKETGRKGLRPLWAAIIILAFFAPLGLLAPGAPWGEWAPAEFKTLIGYVPSGMNALSGQWKGIMPGYGAGASNGLHRSLYYALSALVGSGAVVFAVYLWGRLWRR